MERRRPGRAPSSPAGPDRPGGHQHRRTGSPGRVGAVGLALLDRLDRFSLDVLEAIAALPRTPRARPISVAALPGASADEIEVVEIARALALALVFGPDDDLRLVRTVVEALDADAPAGLGAAMAPAQERLRCLIRRTEQAQPPCSQTRRTERSRPSTAWRLPGTSPRSARQRPPPSGRPRRRRAHPWSGCSLTSCWSGSVPSTVVLPREVALHLRGGAVHRDTIDQGPGAHRHGAVGQGCRPVSCRTGVRRGAAGRDDARGVGPRAASRCGGWLGVRDLRRTAQLLDVDDRTTGLVIETAFAAGLVAADGDSTRPSRRRRPTTSG